MQNPQLAKAKEAIDQWAEGSKTHAENQAVRGLLRSITRTSPTVDRFSVWLLTGVAASIALFVSNLKSLEPLFYQSRFRTVILLLTASIACGFLQKLLAHIAAVHNEASIASEVIIKEIFQEYALTKAKIEDLAEKLEYQSSTELRLDRIFDEVGKRMPWLLRRSFSKCRKKFKRDPYFAEAQALFYVTTQSLCVTLQMVAILAALIFMGVSLR